MGTISVTEVCSVAQEVRRGIERRKRHNSNYSQIELARSVGVHHSVISYLVNAPKGKPYGLRRRNGRSLVDRVAEELDIPQDVIRQAIADDMYERGMMGHILCSATYPSDQHFHPPEKPPLRQVS